MSIPRLITRRKKVRFKKLITLQFFTGASKREKLIFSACLMTTIVLLSSLAKDYHIWIFLFALSGFVAVTTIIFSLKDDLIGGIRSTLIPILPVLFTLGFELTIKIIPMHPLLAFLLTGVFGICFYLILLITNILTISASRTIPLILAARAASFFFVLLSVFLWLFFVATLRLHPVLVSILSFPIVFSFGVYVLWSIDFRSEMRQIVSLASILAIVAMQMAFAISLWPVSPLLAALFETTVYYVVAGVLHQSIQNRLKRRIIIEYIAVLVFAFCLLYLTAQWGQ